MFIHIAIHRPKPEARGLVLASMQRAGAAMAAEPGLQQVFTLQDQKSDSLVGLALWDSKDHWLAARSAFLAVVADDDFDAWEDDPPEVYHLEPAAPPGL
jgi:heme-degrading monooxygenase HmoA